MIWGQNKIIGLDIDEGSCIAAALVKKGERLLLAKTVGVSDVKELSKNSFFKNAQCMISLPAQAVLFRSFQLSAAFLNSKNRQRDILAFLVRQNLPFKLEECFWDTFIVGTYLNFVAARVDVVNKLVAAIQQSGVGVSGVTASFIALQNVLIFNYPNKLKDKFVVFNIRNSAAELVIYEAGRLWSYPLSIGKKDLQNTPQAQEKFAQEIQRVFNAHYLQNAAAAGSASQLYLCGQECPANFAAALKNVFTNFEIINLDPLQKISAGSAAVTNKQSLALSLGLGVSSTSAPGCLSLNLIKGKLQKEQSRDLISLAKNLLLMLAVVCAISLFFFCAGVFLKLQKEALGYQKTQGQVSRLLPLINELKTERQDLERLKNYLEGRLYKQNLYLKAMVAIAQCKPNSVKIKEFDSEIKEKGVKIYLAGTAGDYDYINELVGNMKKDKDIGEVKVVTSTFPGAEVEKKDIDFKLRFEIQ